MNFIAYWRQLAKIQQNNEPAAFLLLEANRVF